jgi:hypothetical protein
MNNPERIERDKEYLYLFNLEQAHTAAQKALDILYDRDGPNRSLLCRMLLGRAQSILIGLYVQELQRQKEK